MHYRVYRSRFDISESKYTEFDADSDVEAVQKFERISAQESNGWDNMRLIEVVVIEQTRHVAYNKNMERFLERDE
jgi:hypothetical protein